MSDDVRIEIPAESLNAFAARVVAAWLVAEGGGDVDAVEDARLAVDEVVAAFVSRGCAVEATYRYVEDAVEVDVVSPARDCPVELSPLAERVVFVVADQCRPLQDDRTGYTVRLRLGARPEGVPESPPVSWAPPEPREVPEDGDRSAVSDAVES